MAPKNVRRVALARRANAGLETRNLDAAIQAENAAAGLKQS
jgi:hypothetical protein